MPFSVFPCSEEDSGNDGGVDMLPMMVMMTGHWWCRSLFRSSFWSDP